jgi:hypothetical protein
MKTFNKKLTTIISLSVFSFFIIQSCKKAEIDSDLQSSTDNSIAEQAFGNIMPMVSSVAVKEEGLNKMAVDYSALTCASIKLIGDTNTFPQQPLILEIDFGTGCIDQDGRYRKGKISATFNNYWDSTGATIEAKLISYFVDGIEYRGTIQLINNGNHSFTTNIKNGKCISTSPSWEIQYNSSQTTKWTKGFDTDSTATDDVFEVTGNANGIDRNKKAFQTVIMKPLVKKGDCKWIVSGQFEIVPEGLSARSVDFGDGTCDNKAKVTINGNVFEIVMQ